MIRLYNVLYPASLIEENTSKRAGGRCLTSGGLRSGLIRKKSRPDRVKRGQNGVQGLSPCRDPRAESLAPGGPPEASRKNFSSHQPFSPP